ncbi:MAG: hypothetical protein ACP5OR_03860 [Candidatus Dormibacteria bacterium]
MAQEPKQHIITRFTTIVFALLSTLSIYGVNFILVQYGSRGAGGAGMVLAVLMSVSVVATCLAWVFGCVLAFRKRSFLWGLIVILLPLPPLGSLLIALFGYDAHHGWNS